MDLNENFTAGYICGQGRNDKILEVVRFRVQIQEILDGFFNIASRTFSTIWLIHVSLETRSSAICRESARLTSLCCMVQKHFDMFNRLGVDHECDGRTDRLKPYSVARSISIKLTA